MAGACGHADVIMECFLGLKGFSHSFEKNVKSIINEAKPTKNQFLLN